MIGYSSKPEMESALRLSEAGAGQDADSGLLEKEEAVLDIRLKAISLNDIVQFDKHFQCSLTIS